MKTVKDFIFYGDERGTALVAVVLTMLVMLSLLTALFSITTAEARIAVNDLDATRAFYLAEGGIQFAVEHLYENPLFRGELLDEPINLGNGNIKSITVEGSGSNVIVASTAEVGGIEERVVVSLIINTGSGVFKNVLTAFGENSTANIGSRSKIKSLEGEEIGAAVFNGNLTLGSRSEILIPVAVKGSFIKGSGTEVLEEVEFDDSMVPGPVDTAFLFPSIEEPASSSMPGEFTEINPGMFAEGGVYLVQGNAVVSDLQDVTIYATGSIIISNGSELQSSVLISEGEVTVGSEVEMYHGALLTNSDISVKQSCEMKNVEITSGGSLTLGSECSFEECSITVLGSTSTGWKTEFKKGSIVSYGSFTAGSQLNLEGTDLLCGDSVNLGSSSQLKDMFLMAEGDVTAGSSIEGEDCAIYTNGLFNCGSGLELIGALFAENINLGSEAEIVYRDVISLGINIPPEFTGTKITFIDWQQN